MKMEKIEITIDEELEISRNKALRKLDLLND